MATKAAQDVQQPQELSFVADITYACACARLCSSAAVVGEAPGVSRVFLSRLVLLGPCFCRRDGCGQIRCTNTQRREMMWCLQVCVLRCRTVCGVPCLVVGLAAAGTGAPSPFSSACCDGPLSDMV